MNLPPRLAGDLRKEPGRHKPGRMSLAKGDKRHKRPMWKMIYTLIQVVVFMGWRTPTAMKMWRKLLAC
jgi:hypothetical protein